MEDEEIIKLFFARDERAISESNSKYGALCRFVAQRILNSAQDAEEVENDAYLRAWNTIPPQKPRSLSAYLASLSRCCAIDRLRGKTSAKRGGGAFEEAFEELKECLPSDADGDYVEGIALCDALNAFLADLPKDQRVLFMRRYWWSFSIEELAQAQGMSENAVKSALFRIREKLRAHLEKEGIEL